MQGTSFWSKNPTQGSTRTENDLQVTAEHPTNTSPQDHAFALLGHADVTKATRNSRLNCRTMMWDLHAGAAALHPLSGSPEASTTLAPFHHHIAHRCSREAGGFSSRPCRANPSPGALPSTKCQLPASTWRDLKAPSLLLCKDYLIPWQIK